MEENEPKQRRPRTSNPAFSTPEQPTPQKKPAKAPPPVTFRPPADDKTASGTGADAPEAPPSTRQQRGPAKSAPRKSTPRSPAKSTPPPAASAPNPPAKAQPTTAPPTKAAPQARTTPAKRPPRKATAPAKPEPAKAAATVKAVAAEIAPDLVKPDMTTVPDEPAAPAGDAPEMAQGGATSPAAEPPATAPGQPGAAVPVAPTLPRAAASVPDTVSAARTEAWAALIADPVHGPELLAVAATQTIGPRAIQWASRTRAAYPGATPDALARLAVRQFTRFGSVSSIFAAIAGSYAPVALLGAAAFTHAELALHVAAAYGLDPTDRERAVDLLVLTRVHPGREDAEAALAAAEQHAYEQTGLTDATWRLGRMLAAQAGGWAAVRVVNHFFPGTSLLVATLTSRGAARSMAARATVHYRDQYRAVVRAS